MNSFTETVDVETVEKPKPKPKSQIVKPNKDNVVELRGNKNIISVLTSEFLKSKECDAILKECVLELWLNSDVVGQSDKGRKKKKLREATQQNLPMNEKGWPYTKVLELTQQANIKNFKMNVAGFFQADNPQIVRYKNKSFYDWHLDIGNNAPFRKLTFIVQLSDSDDYDGGNLELMNMITDGNLFRKKGQIIIFPSFVPWRITKVTKGVRNAIEAWIHGPSFV